MKRTNAGAARNNFVKSYIKLCSSAFAYCSMTHRSREMIAAFVLIAALCMQNAVVFSQTPQQPSFGYQGQGSIPQSWAAPYYAAASNSWMDYFKQAQDISNQFMKQWDKTGAASSMFNMGMDYAKQAAKEFEKTSSGAAKQAQNTVGKIPFF